MIKKIKEIYNHRELLGVFARKELKVKYKNSYLGFLWSFINPLVMAVVYTFVFGFLGNKSIKDFALFLIIGLIPWNFFATTIAISTNSIMANANLIKKVYFPKEIVPLSIVFANLVNFLLEMVVVLTILLIMGYNFLPFLPVIFLAIILQVIVITGLSLFFSSITVYFRDMEQLITMLLLVWFFATPIVYSLSDVASKAPFIALLLKVLNPMTAIILLYKQSLYFLSWPSLSLITFGIGNAIFIFIIGYYFFSKLSPNFAKEI